MEVASPATLKFAAHIASVGGTLLAESELFGALRGRSEAAGDHDRVAIRIAVPDHVGIGVGVGHPFGRDYDNERNPRSRVLASAVPG